MGFMGLSMQNRQYPFIPMQGGRTGSFEIGASKMAPGGQGQGLADPRISPRIPTTGTTPNAGKNWGDPYGAGGGGGFSMPGGATGPLPELVRDSGGGGQDWSYGAPAVPVGNLADIGIPLEDQIAIQSVGNKIKQFGGGYEYSPTKPGVVYSSQNGPYDNSGVPITTGYPGLGMSGVVAKSSGITGGPGYAAPAQTRPGEARLPGQPTDEERSMALTGRSLYGGYAQLATAPQTADILAAPPQPQANALAASTGLQTAVQGKNTRAIQSASLIDAFRSVSGGFFQRPKGGGGGSKQTFLGSSNPTGGFFGASQKRGRNSLLG